MLTELAYPAACLNGIMAAYLDSETVVGKHVPSHKTWLFPYLGAIDLSVLSVYIPSSYFFVSEVCYVGGALFNAYADYEYSSAAALEITARLGIMHAYVFYNIHDYVNPIPDDADFISIDTVPTRLNVDETTLVLSSVLVSD
jgi:hypothetical protein